MKPLFSVAAFGAWSLALVLPGRARFFIPLCLTLAFAWQLGEAFALEDLETGEIQQLTRRDNESIINGIMSWAYEEEFSIRDGFRWSPDSSRIAYWQFDTSGVKDFMIINNTDTLYPTITRIPYPKVGETISAARVGVVSLRTGNTAWAFLPGNPRNNYIPRMQWAESSDELLLQHVNRKQDTNNVYLVDAASGESRAVFTDQELHYLDDFHDVEWLDDGEAFTFVSERSGWRHVHKVSRGGRYPCLRAGYLRIFRQADENSILFAKW